MKSCPDCAATYPDDYALCPKDGAPLRESTLWQIGTVVRGKYRILARLGEGGMATVYKAHHELLDELRALKVIKPQLALDAEFMGRFKNEAIMARRLNHPNAVRVDDLDVAEDGLPFIAMELVVGDTLKTLIQRTGPLPVPLVLDISADVCSALDAAHKLGLIHRDIKPENILLVPRRNGTPIAKILDFGISRLQEETSRLKGLTQTGMVIGTPEYMSPEQAVGKRAGEIDGRSDLYSLGVVMYRMLTGELPFEGQNTVEMILQHMKTPATPPHQAKLGLAIPEVVSAIVMKALEKDRNRRFDTAKVMGAAIKRARGSPTLSGRRIDWSSLSSSAASFGIDKDAASSAAPPGAQTGSPSASPGARPAAPAAPAPDRPIYRSSARLGPPPREFPTQWVLLFFATALLVWGGLAGWKRLRHWYVDGQTAGAPASSPKDNPATPTAPGSTRPASGHPQSTTGRSLSFEDQAKVRELNSLAAIYYKQGGCLKALPTYQQVLDIDPSNAQAYAAIQNCYAKARDSQIR